MKLLPHIRPQGFTLIEVMIAIAIIGILAGIAYPSYTDHLKKSRRSEAKQALVDVAQRMERLYSERNTFEGATLGSGGFPAALTTNGHYLLSLSNVTASTFTITATPQGNHSTDKCGSFTYDHAGTRGLSGATMTTAQCW